MYLQAVAFLTFKFQRSYHSVYCASQGILGAAKETTGQALDAAKQAAQDAYGRSASLLAIGCEVRQSSVLERKLNYTGYCRAAQATHEAQESLRDVEETLQKPANWEGSNSPEGVWSKIKKTVTGTPPSPTEKAQQTARDAVHATQKAADEAIRRAKQVPLLCQEQGL